MQSMRIKAAYLFGIGIAVLGGCYNQAQSQEAYAYKLLMQEPEQVETINLSSQGLFKSILQPGHFHINSLPRRIVNASSDPLKLQISLEGLPADFMIYTRQEGWHRLEVPGTLELAPDSKVLFRLDTHMDRAAALASEGGMLRLNIQEQNQGQRQHVHYFFMTNK